MPALSSAPSLSWCCLERGMDAAEIMPAPFGIRHCRCPKLFSRKAGRTPRIGAELYDRSLTRSTTESPPGAGSNREYNRDRLRRSFCLCCTALRLASDSRLRLDAISVGGSHHEIKNATVDLGGACRACACRHQLCCHAPHCD